jgi:hypothetical protein
MAITLRNLPFHLDPLALEEKRGSRLAQIGFKVSVVLIALIAAAELLFFLVLLWQLL